MDNKLTPVEKSILQPLVDNKNKVVPFDWFSQNVVGVDRKENLYVWIFRLRRKIGKDKIVRVKKKGYKYTG